MALVHVVIALALLQFFAFGILVGRARIRFEIPAPAMAGNEIFERYVRVHYNTMEQLVCLVPGLLLFGYYVNAVAAAILGLIFIAGRFLYLKSYVAEPAKRGPGFGLSVLPVMILLLGGLGGALWSALGAG